jgi:hypothetical protein
VRSCEKWFRRAAARSDDEVDVSDFVTVSDERFPEVSLSKQFPGSGVWRRRNHDPTRGRMNDAARICLYYRTT